jgi:hypothetical protein
MMTIEIAKAKINKRKEETPKTINSKAKEV